MNRSADGSGWRQHFPTYHFSRRDVALLEYGVATKTLEADERVFLNAANISVAVGATLGSVAIGSLDKVTEKLAPIVPAAAVHCLLLFLAIGFAALTLRYFADRQKAIVFASRKVIVLRRMLGMSYGTLQLVLPNWRLEGADEPFAIRLFPGWQTYVVYPCYAIAGICSAFAFFVIAAILKDVDASGGEWPFSPFFFVVGASAALFVGLCWTYRKALVDTHERGSLLIAKQVARVLRVRLVGNFENTIYRASLATYELHRLHVDLASLKRVLVHVEDKEFFTHSGISGKGLGRLFMSALRLRSRSGGSTLTQQLVRTLFIEDQSKLYRRKLVELLLARWLDSVMSKDRQLDTYLAAVRFEKGVMGLAAAMKFYFGGIRGQVSPAEAFFLVERVSNIRSRLLVEKVDQTLRIAVSRGVLSRPEALRAVALYWEAVRVGKIHDPEGNAADRLAQAWT